jgi:hypothetical protein
MMKRINISTKFSVLILAVSLTAVSAISFFSYDYHIKTNQEKFATNLAVIADNQTAYFNTYFEKAERALQYLQNSEMLRAKLASGAGGGMDLMMAPIGGAMSAEGDSSDVEAQDNSLEGYLSQQKLTLEVSDITLTSGTGAVTATTDALVKGNIIDPDGVSFDRAKSGVYFSPVQRDKSK